MTTLHCPQNVPFHLPKYTHHGLCFVSGHFTLTVLNSDGQKHQVVNQPISLKIIKILQSFWKFDCSENILVFKQWCKTVAKED